MRLLIPAILIVALTADVALAPVAVYPSHLNFGTTRNQMTAEVWNSRRTKMRYKITTDAKWQSVSPTSGDSSGEHDTIAVTVDRSGLAVGTYTSTITIHELLPGDINSDGKVDLADLLLLAQVWGSCVGDANYNSDADVNGDGCVNLPDLLISARYWDKATKELGDAN